MAPTDNDADNVKFSKDAYYYTNAQCKCNSPVALNPKIFNSKVKLCSHMQIYGVTRYETYGRLIRLVHERVFFFFFCNRRLWRGELSCERFFARIKVNLLQNFGVLI